MTICSYIGLGANLGAAADTVRRALTELGALPDTRLAATSPLYRTPAWGGIAQPDFINAVAAIETTLPAPQLLSALMYIEQRHGRVRPADHSDRWGPRMLDLDILLYSNLCLELPDLRIPHPHLHERAFVLVPLLEIAPDIHIPGIGPACQALAALAATDAPILRIE